MFSYLLMPFIFACQLYSSNIYDQTITDIQGNTIPLENFRGKKILFVNTASNSPLVDQYASLETLYQQYKDSLVVIAFPSNSFGNEPADDSTIYQFVSSTYHISYILAAKSEVLDSSSINPVFGWIKRADENGQADFPVQGDFSKFMINGEGRLIGIFYNERDPLDDIIKSAIEN